VRVRALLISVELFFMCVSACALADGAACGSPEQPWVRVVFSASATQEPLKSAMLTDLRAGLAPSNIGVCRDGAPSESEPVAILNCSFSANGLRASLEVVDRVTEKRVERDIQLDALPADGRSLALAVESEELLRASWAELGLIAAAHPKKAPPAELRAAIEPLRVVHAARGTAIGARVAFAHYGGAQTQYGGDAFTLIALPARLSLEVALGLRGALATTSAHGTVTASAVSSDLGLHLPWFQSGDLELDAQLGSHFSLIDYEARAVGTTKASAARGFTGTGRIGLGAVFGAAHALRSFTTLGAGLPWLSFAAADGGHIVTGTSGLELYASSGLGLEF
jgi:hypothetical protein